MLSDNNGSGGPSTLNLSNSTVTNVIIGSNAISNTNSGGGNTAPSTSASSSSSSSSASSSPESLLQWCLESTRQALGSMAALSLIVLVLQNSTLVLLTRYSRFSQPPGEMYHTSTLVLNQEIMKMVFCLVIFYIERKQELPHCNIAHELSSIVFHRETLKLVVPAGLFTLQNFLIFVALSHLDAMTFQVLSQTKLLSAAVFSVWLLDRRLNRWQWISLVLLTLGVYFSQQTAQRESFTKDSGNHAGGGAGGHQAQQLQHQQRYQSFFLGAVACIISGLSSSFAGVYFEKVVKTTSPSLAVRNIHLSLFGIPFALLSLLVLDIIPTWWNPHLPRFRFWQGYNGMTWCLVFVHAFGGLLVAVVVKYADNILKGFATGVAVIVSGAFAALFWGYEPSMLFVVGCVLVTTSSMVYHKKDNAPSHPIRSSRHNSEKD
ncbi:UDP-galactose transporter, putative [Bodo saltans]|uniref:UDP-galactose transporter, putative n=2 Tax=Bodo saltans TaxID=75058 RepID=A0A0S4JJ51_BODSA|nr:UDP-galactose transporter, putative [Bodo saltans]|eukprot:CUG88453.1 UDP-galactose transporter, putative [Bodo saltans]